jgi:hypothetical protein
MRFYCTNGRVTLKLYQLCVTCAATSLYYCSYYIFHGVVGIGQVTCDALIRRGKLEWKRKRSCTAINLNLYIVLHYVPPAKTKRRAPAKQITLCAAVVMITMPFLIIYAMVAIRKSFPCLKLVQQKACCRGKNNYEILDNWSRINIRQFM